MDQVNANTVLLVVIAVLTVAELAAAVAIVLAGPKGQTTDLIAIVTGIVGPVVTSLLALWRVEDVARQVQRNGTTQAPTTETPPDQGGKVA